MKYLTRKEYAELNDCTRQAVNDRIRRGTLILAPVKTTEMRIMVEDTEYEKLKAKALARVKER